MPDLFKTDRVCTRCNSLAGQFVDGAFLKSWFLAAENTSAAHRYLDKDKPAAMPLFYHGLADDFLCASDEVCERWIGPAGDHIYHVHKRDDERWETFAGGDVIRRKRDPGRAYMALTSQHPYWFATSVLSFMARFEGATHRLLTEVQGVDLGPRLLNPFQEPLSEIERSEVKFILKKSSWQAAKLPLQIDFADRFLCKVALGLAFKVLGPGVMSTPYSDELRKGLWTVDKDERDKLALRGAGYFQQETDTRASAILHWPGAWIVSLNAFPEGLGLSIVTPGGRHLAMMAAEGHEGWAPEAGADYGAGKVYVVVPQRQLVVGPIDLIEFSGFKAGIGRSAPLERLKALEVPLESLPPKR